MFGFYGDRSLPLHEPCEGRSLIYSIELTNRELKMSDSFRRRPHYYFDVVAEPIQTVHQFTF